MVYKLNPDPLSGYKKKPGPIFAIRTKKPRLKEPIKVE